MALEAMPPSKLAQLDVLLAELAPLVRSAMVAQLSRHGREGPAGAGEAEGGLRKAAFGHAPGVASV